MNGLNDLSSHSDKLFNALFSRQLWGVLSISLGWVYRLSHNSLLIEMKERSGHVTDEKQQATKRETGKHPSL